MEAIAEKKRFMFDMIFVISKMAAFNTRNPNAPIYSEKPHPPGTLDIDLQKLLEAYVDQFKTGKMTEQDHFDSIVHITTEISKKYGEILYKSRFRIGIAQKFLNLALKYLWCIGEISAPFHCPIDSIIIKKIERANPAVKFPKWTDFDCIDDYKRCISALREIAGSDKIAEWELKNWRSA